MKNGTRIAQQPEFPPGTYYTKDRGDGGLDIEYVAPCGDVWDVATIQPNEISNPNPMVEFAHPVIGMDGIIKMGKLFEELRTRKEN